ncbi:MAG: exodeoxyribonuclease VII small subunit [Bacilli bacterium]|nr:exodeoxyribonuclease VII small subunit [Bacilli bacterium]
MSEKKKDETIDFEGSLKRLDEIVEKIESNVLPLDESIKLYEEGSKLIKKLEGALKDAEKKMAKVIDTNAIGSGK